MGNELVSIIIPVYNRAGIVGRTLQSVAAQSYRPLELILVDNNSTDNTLEVLNGFKSRHESPDRPACIRRRVSRRFSQSGNR